MPGPHAQTISAYISEIAEYSIFGRRLRFSGSLLRYYLWAQITAGWLLSAIFIAA